MKGKQTIELNHETVREALQEYLNRHFTSPVEVLSMSADKQQYGTGFSVECQIQPIEAAAAEVV